MSTSQCMPLSSNWSDATLTDTATDKCSQKVMDTMIALYNSCNTQDAYPFDFATTVPGAFGSSKYKDPASMLSYCNSINIKLNTNGLVGSGSGVAPPVFATDGSGRITDASVQAAVTGISTAIIIAIVAGIVFWIAVCGAIIYFCCIRPNRQQQTNVYIPAPQQQSGGVNYPYDGKGAPASYQNQANPAYKPLNP
ncbi:hypothetical protein BC830DRAFT_1114751 [Chytriomyces sp. MP71]|nr:hypothetical protein BC830DRAFT_1114751 [Chytriomyces sp. MP71]